MIQRKLFIFKSKSLKELSFMFYIVFLYPGTLARTTLGDNRQQPCYHRNHRHRLHVFSDWNMSPIAGVAAMLRSNLTSPSFLDSNSTLFGR